MIKLHNLKKINKYKVLLAISVLLLFVAVLDTQHNRNLYNRESIKNMLIKEEVETLKFEKGLKDNEITSLKKEVEDLKAQLPKWTSLGIFEITSYYFGEDIYGDSIAKSCKENDHKKAIVEHTIAVDPNIIPYGTKAKINDVVYVAEDCGGAVKGNVIDVWVENESNSFGRKTSEVFILK